jgi:DNA uptake protein ComE-like DNA-binding protein
MNSLLSYIVALTFSVILFSSHTYATDPPKPVSPLECNLRSESLAELLDINSATEKQLKTLPGINDTYCKRIIEGRPFTNMKQLVSNNIVPQNIFDRIMDLIIIMPPKK